MAARRMRDAYLEVVLQTMRQHDDVFFLTADFGSPVLDRMFADVPDRILNVGIAEQNLVNIATGLALEGYRVVAYAIAPFVTMRCLEQTRVQLAILSQLRPMTVNLVGVGAGLSYDVSGPTHQTLEDLSIMRSLANMGVFSPSDAETAAAIAAYGLERPGIRYVRMDSKPLPTLHQAPGLVDLDRGHIRCRAGSEACIVATGYMTHVACAAADLLARERGWQVGVLDVLHLSQPDPMALRNELQSTPAILTLEEGFIGRGGLDSYLRTAMDPLAPGQRTAHLGLPLAYTFEMGSREQILADLGLSPAAVAARVSDLLSTPSRHG